VLELLGEGHTTAQIAEKLFVSSATVRTHVASTLRKLSAPDREAAVALLKQLDAQTS
jgi:DNA-binding NarL/FixJ family response regulator